MTGSSDPFLPYGHQSIDDDDVAAVTEALTSDWLTTGPRVEAFEEAVAQSAGVSHGVAVNSGTAALHCACSAAGLSEGDEAVVPALTFAATANAVRLCGAEVRFADIDPETLGLSVEALEPKLTDQTRAVLPVDFAGHPCDWDGISALLQNREIVTIDDAAHALGATYKSRAVGSLADMTCFSFHPVKAITSAEGGMVVTNSADYASALKRLRNHGMVRSAADFKDQTEAYGGGESADGPAPWYYEVHEPGVNYRISDVQCALGLSQLKKLTGFIARRRELVQLYEAGFSGADLLHTPAEPKEGLSAWHLYVIRLNLDALLVSRRKIFDELRRHGLGVQVHYMPLHLHPYYRQRYGHQRGDFPHAEAYYDEAITLPLYPAMTNDDAERVVETVLDVLTAVKR